MSQAIVKSIRSKYPTPLGAQHAAFLMEVAPALGLGLVDKPNGSHVQLPSGQFVSQDVVMDHSGNAWDILSDADGVADPAFNPIDKIDPSRYVSVNTGASGSTTPPPPAPAPVDLTPVVTALNALAGGIGTLATQAQQYDEANERRYKDLVAHFDALPKPSSAPVPTIPAGHVDIGDVVKLAATIAGFFNRPAAVK